MNDPNQPTEDFEDGDVEVAYPDEVVDMLQELEDK